jgi:hypothetical protein
MWKGVMCELSISVYLEIQAIHLALWHGQRTQVFHKTCKTMPSSQIMPFHMVFLVLALWPHSEARVTTTSLAYHSYASSINSFWFIKRCGYSGSRLWSKSRPHATTKKTMWKGIICELGNFIYFHLLSLMSGMKENKKGKFSIKPHKFQFFERFTNIL